MDIEQPKFVPATCDNGHTFWPSAYQIADGGVIRKHGRTRTGQCPECGEPGTIAAGRYELVDGTVQRTGDP